MKNIIFDMGGVLITLGHERAIQRFQQIGISDAANLLDPYMQGGPFGALEQGDISVEEFIDEMTRLAGRQVTYDECYYGWLGYAVDAPARNFELLSKLRQEGYRLILLSNMNPFINAWLETELKLSTYFDSCYRSYEIRMMKPDPRVFSLILEREGIKASETLLVDDGPRNCAAASALGFHTFQPTNGEDWTKRIYDYLAI